MVGIDFSLAKTGKKKKQKRTDPPTTCPHGVMYDYSSSNAIIDLPALPCPTCKQAQQDAINLVISFRLARLPFSYIQTQECLVFN